MDLIKISESDNCVVRYDRCKGMYIVSVFEDGHCKYEIYFDAYEEKELLNTGVVGAYKGITIGTCENCYYAKNFYFGGLNCKMWDATKNIKPNGFCHMWRQKDE